MGHLILVLMVLIPVALGYGWDTKTPLDDYVARPDSHYKWNEIDSFDQEDCTIYRVNMTSQKWLTEAETTQPIWQHYMIVTIPKNFTYKDAGFIYIDGGNNGGDPPDPDGTLPQAMCTFSNSVGVAGSLLYQIPNQPIYFKNDPSDKRRFEDSLIAWTWRSYIEDPSNPDIIARLPMTKATVRALDTVAALTREKVPDSNVTRFMVAGASKRGWTAWTTACVDRRVIALGPIVLTALNFVKTVHHYYRSLGGWSFALKDYHDENLTLNLDHPNTQKIMDIVDAYNYKERLTMPKLVVHATADEFFMPDDPHYWFSELPDPKYLLLLDNTNHGVILSEPRVAGSFEAFYKSILTGTKLPSMSWIRNETQTSGSITLYTDTTPKLIRSWSGDTNDTKRRDFRWITNDDINPIIWDDIPVEDLGNGVYRIEYMKNESFWKEFHINAIYQGPDDTELDFTTECNIIPDVFPYPDCQGTACKGTIV